MTKHNNNFAVMRLLLASLVLLSHSSEIIDGNRSRETLTLLFHNMSFGELAVDGFFVLSGYLITESWMHDPDLRRFFTKRVLRIYPGFLVACLACGLVFGALGTQNAPAYYAHLSLVKGVLQPALLLMRPVVPPCFVGTPLPLINTSLWTIPYEFRCYLLVALLGAVRGFRSRISATLLLAALLILFVFSALSPSVILRFGEMFPEKVTAYLGEPEACFRLGAFFLSGMCFFLWRDKVVFSRRTSLIFGIFVLASMFSYTVSRLMLPTLGAYLLLAFGYANLPLLRRFNTLPDLSYGIYLYGWPVQKLLQWYFPGVTPVVMFPASLAISAVFAAASWYGVEKPFLRLKPKPAKSSPAKNTEPEKETTFLPLPQNTVSSR